MDHTTVVKAGLGVLALLMIGLSVALYYKLSLAIDLLGKPMPKIADDGFAQVEALLALQTTPAASGRRSAQLLLAPNTPNIGGSVTAVGDNGSATASGYLTGLSRTIAKRCTVWVQSLLITNSLQRSPVCLRMPRLTGSFP